MPDNDIRNALGTESPRPEFVADTRQMLRAAWNAPAPQSPPGGSPGGGSGNIGRWMAGGGAAGLVVVGIIALVVLGTRPTSDSAIVPTVPTIAVPSLPPSGTVAVTTAPSPSAPPDTASTPSTQVPATPPPVVNTPPPTRSPTTVSPTTVVVDPKEPIPTGAPTSGPPTSTTTTTSTTIAPTTSTTVPPTSIYVLAPVPDWAQGAITDPISNVPNDGVYASVDVIPNGDGVGLRPTRAYIGFACRRHFGPFLSSKECARGYGFDTVAPERIGALGATPVVAAFTTPNGDIARYRIPASELINLLSGGTPHPSSPPGITLSVAFYKFQLVNGQVAGIVGDPWATVDGIIG